MEAATVSGWTALSGSQSGTIGHQTRTSMWACDLAYIFIHCTAHRGGRDNREALYYNIDDLGNLAEEAFMEPRWTHFTDMAFWKEKKLSRLYVLRI